MLRLDKQHEDHRACENNFFVAAHMFSLPFNWQGQFFIQVVRLQMNELNEDHFGLSIEKMMEVVKSLPHLRRLGTLSLKAASFLNFVEGNPLEELVMTLEMDEMEQFLRMWLPLEEKGRRTHLRRLAVHLVASHGCCKRSREEEAAICSGWYTIASTMLHPTGIVAMSVAYKQILETALFQMPWHEPTWLSLDKVEYSDGRIPHSTPLQRPLQHCLSEFVERPQGSLITGPLRPKSHGDNFNDTGSSLKSEMGASRRSVASTGMFSQPKEWLMKFGDAVGVLGKIR